MADWSALTTGFQQGQKSSDEHRKSKQYEKMRDQALELGQYDVEAARKYRKARNPETASVLGDDYMSDNTDWAGGLEDPFAVKLMDKFQGWRTNNKFKKAGGAANAQGYADQALELGSTPPPLPETAFSNAEEPQQPEMQTGTLQMADGGDTSEGLTEKQIRAIEARNAQEARAARVEILKDRVTTGARSAANTVREGAKYKGLVSKGTGFLKGLAGGVAAGAGIAGALKSADTPTDEYAERYGFDWMQPHEGDSNAMRTARELGTRTIGTMVDVGNSVPGVSWLTGADDEKSPAPQPALRSGIPQPAAGSPGNPMQLSTTTIRGQRGGIPTSPQQQQRPDFSDIDPADVPDMKTDEWKKYRAQMMAAAQASGKPEAVGQANDMVTQMQMRNFMNYGQQGLALQQAGNVRGAMSAYRAAFQYFPNGYDVEFGVHRNQQTGQQEIVGYGKDEKSGKRVPGSEIVMDPARVTAMMENFSKPGAWNLWVKDQKDFQQQLRKYEEVDKPTAQSEADYRATAGQAQLTNAQADLTRAGALASAGAGGFKQSDSRAAQEMFSQMMMEQGVTDPQEAMQLGSFCIQLKQRNPQLSETQIAQMVLQRAGKLQ